MPERSLADFAVILNPRDNVATALVDMPAGEYRLADGSVLAVAEDIRAGFKVAVATLRPGDAVIKYGYVIGTATAEVRSGRCVHVHNVASCFSPQEG